jgi:NCAIR mutase (PurE)-related protein
MNPESLKKLLASVQAGELSVDEAMMRLKHLPYENIGFARIDHHRHLRTGFPEVVFCQGKTPEQIRQIIERIHDQKNDVLATRADENIYTLVQEVDERAEYNAEGRTIVIRNRKRKDPVGRILIISAGTSDIPVAEEAAVTADIMGSGIERLYDVGVAGIHRLLDQKELFDEARVIVVVAGMEGALASVVGGLVDKPIIAVPTSIGYGASFGGIAALLSMLNSCAAGISVVNIDNGFGAARAAHLINILGENRGGPGAI